MMNSAQAVVAIVGTGSIGETHLRVLSQTASVRPVAVPVRRARLAELAAAGFDVAEDLQGAARQGASAAVIATDSGRHVADALEAMACGLDVLVEKPLAVDAEGGRRLCGRAEALGRRVFVGCTLRFSESLRRFRELLPRVGLVQTVRIECQSYLPEWRPARPYRDSYSARVGEGGVLLDLIHEIDYAGWLFGWPGSVQGRLLNIGRLGIEVEEIAELTWETPSGCLVSVCLDYLSRPSRRRMRAYGEEGTLKWDGVANVVAMERPGSPTDVTRLPQTREQVLLTQDVEFLQARAGGAETRLANGEDGVRALAVCDAARTASAQRRAVAVEYPL